MFYYQDCRTKPRLSHLNKKMLKEFLPAEDEMCVKIISYCLMPNHFHLLLQQLKAGGIAKFLSQISNSYTRYFNTKYGRTGSLLQGVFKSVYVEDDEQLMHLSRYIHLNPTVSGLVKRPQNYPYSSYSSFLAGEDFLCSLDEILSFFPKKGSYQEFVDNQIDYGKSLEVIKHKSIDFH